MPARVCIQLFSVLPGELYNRDCIIYLLHKYFTKEEEEKQENFSKRKD